MGRSGAGTLACQSRDRLSDDSGAERHNHSSRGWTERGSFRAARFVANWAAGAEFLRRARRGSSQKNSSRRRCSRSAVRRSECGSAQRTEIRRLRSPGLLLWPCRGDIARRRRRGWCSRGARVISAFIPAALNTTSSLSERRHTKGWARGPGRPNFARTATRARRTPLPGTRS
jgi:hypothetical protein